METGGERPKPSNPDSMAALRAAKKALRAEIKSRISALSPQEKLRQSAIVTQKLITHTRYQSCQRIAVFLSMSDEVQTEEIIKNIFQCGKECFIPRYKKKSNHMDMIKLSVMEEICSLPLTSWNIQQPADDDPREDALATVFQEYWSKQVEREEGPTRVWQKSPCCLVCYQHCSHFYFYIARSNRLLYFYAFIITIQNT
ncbi:5,10-methenyltetrahydrofolate synthetase (5-formyltetrahydrofolate cyclo-ligase) isoform X2 [Latimeria chalumnae]|uniref:5,10-methenyltetrahydrofolate synthetase (5-formyltetrahydrofolate cyclo-ligase) isoform X2 n=1 Tax=Latimeria chalumnae TaxID=7897 RepID=UPI0003C1348B|nr:PREDICTED: 5-formyltetrahydrofolate cyclo-ligase isoform X2 [Latimeria chalumnae]|eukprot:XP_005989639.1 PREDICTED: 5-formyltetrahydrofolate cyclo-ligase isoform X2 [Latimeria chalumnae]